MSNDVLSDRLGVFYLGARCANFERIHGSLPRVTTGLQIGELAVTEERSEVTKAINATLTANLLPGERDEVTDCWCAIFSAEGKADQCFGASPLIST